MGGRQHQHQSSPSLPSSFFSGLWSSGRSINNGNNASSSSLLSLSNNESSSSLASGAESSSPSVATITPARITRRVSGSFHRRGGSDLFDAVSAGNGLSRLYRSSSQPTLESAAAASTAGTSSAFDTTRLSKQQAIMRELEKERE